ncbi:hypothetical protein PRZ48_003409 [Zasmidium cellare]|uniref:Uncharacterized protein n=1 Tax=Zasmidium cellare TaxID=395010 RepID=A0ABR0EWI0_ZASCE|nr:hypothetical protein PRZ48_003409 [Zasmidium cellare]
MRKRALIALFNRETLLNRQGGGKFTSSLPPQEDEPLFQKLKTKAFETFTSDHPIHPEEVGTLIEPLTDAHAQVWADQANSATFFGEQLLLFVGDYCPFQAIVNTLRFWKQDQKHQAV